MRSDVGVKSGHYEIAHFAGFLGFVFKILREHEIE